MSFPPLTHKKKCECGLLKDERLGVQMPAEVMLKCG